mmetsp:Transcript_1785/g.2495  ORF Transcript_1785/g.2495 Transcript_1785/m.2495 type:complete len:316 (+) Transcript_1785:304-1251(+)
MSAIIDLVESTLGVSNDMAMIMVGTTVVAIVVAGFLVSSSQNKHPIAMTADFTEFPLIQREELSHDTRKFTFGLPSEQHVLGLPIGQHMTLKFIDPKDGKGVQRSYTPVSRQYEKGSVSFVIKVYKAGVHPKFPEGGKMSQHLDSLSIGDTILMKGPKGHMDWKGYGNFTVKQMRKPLETRKATHIGMIAGGTGITPMLQILHAIFERPNDKTVVSLIYANQTEDDILVREELENLAKEYPNQFKLHYTVDKAPSDDWKYSVGFVTKDMIDAHLPKKQSNGHTQIYMCGPPPMIKFACLPALQELGFVENEWFVF